MPKAVTISKASSGRAASVIKQRTRKQKSVPGSSTQNPSTGVLAPTASKVTKRKGKVAPQPAARASKRGKRKETQSSTDVVDLTGEGGDNVKPPRTLPNKSKAKARKDDSEEKRMKRHVVHISRTARLRPGLTVHSGFDSSLPLASENEWQESRLKGIYFLVMNFSSQSV